MKNYLQAKIFSASRRGLTLLFLIVMAGLVAACGEEPTPVSQTPATTTAPAQTPGGSQPTVQPITFPPLILAEPLQTVVATTTLPNAPAQPVPTKTVLPPTALPPTTAKPAVDGAPRPVTTTPLAANVPDSRAGGELVGKTLQGAGFRLTVKRVERLSRIRDNAGKYTNPAANAVFLVVLYDIRNESNQPMGYPTFSLRDAAGNNYSTSTNPQLEAAQKSYKLFWDTPEVKPSATAQQYRIFEVPKNAANFQLINK